MTLALCIRPTSSCREGRTRRFCTVYLSICHLLPSYRARATRGRHQRIPRRVSATYGVKLWCLVCDHSKTKIFGCCWRESVSCSLYYCKTLTMSYIVDQRIILFWKRALNSDNIIIATLARIKGNEVGMILSKYNIPSLNLSQLLSSLACGNILLMLHVIADKFLFCKPSLYIVF